jgi:hypothetical protein
MQTRLAGLGMQQCVLQGSVLRGHLPLLAL